jgi:hypothetical protein
VVGYVSARDARRVRHPIAAMRCQPGHKIARTAVRRTDLDRCPSGRLIPAAIGHSGPPLTRLVDDGQPARWS